MTADASSERAGAAAECRTDRRVLSATVVNYRNGPDRCTVTPADVSDEERFTAWLSVDADAMLSLAEFR